jgi:nucleotide-binding universal stress UspA family protein
MVAWMHNRDEDIEAQDDALWERSWDVTAPYKCILAAIDQNPWSDDAITHAVTLASHASARLIMVMVPTGLLFQEAPAGLGFTDRVTDAITDECNAILAWAAAAAEHAAVPYTTMFRWGNFVPTILHVADEEHCDLIVIGSPVKAGWDRFFQPSYAKYVAAHARQPVLVVKARAHAARHATLRSHWRSR